MIKKTLLLLVLGLIALTLASCAGASRSAGAFGQGPITAASTPVLASSGVETTVSTGTSARAIADMNAL